MAAPKFESFRSVMGTAGGGVRMAGTRARTRDKGDGDGSVGACGETRIGRGVDRVCALCGIYLFIYACDVKTRVEA